MVKNDKRLTESCAATVMDEAPSLSHATASSLLLSAGLSFFLTSRVTSLRITRSANITGWLIQLCNATIVYQEGKFVKQHNQLVLTTVCVKYIFLSFISEVIS